MDRQEFIRKCAARYIEKYDVSVIPLGREKRPAVASWEPWQHRVATIDEVNQWRCDNIGLVTGEVSGIVVVDCERREDAKWFYNNCGRTNTIVQTPRGFHLYFQWPGCHVANAQRLQGKYDIRGDGGYVVAPPSVVNDKQYKFVDNCPMRDAVDLPLFDMRWRYPDGDKAPQPRESKQIRDGVRYIKTFRAVAGEAGHSATYKAACYLKESGLSEAEALAAMIEWNQTNCDPPWSTAELLHKIKGAYSK